MEKISIASLSGEMQSVRSGLEYLSQIERLGLPTVVICNDTCARNKWKFGAITDHGLYHEGLICVDSNVVDIATEMLVNQHNRVKRL